MVQLWEVAWTDRWTGATKCIIIGNIYFLILQTVKKTGKTFQPWLNMTKTEEHKRQVASFLITSIAFFSMSEEQFMHLLH